MICSVAEVRPVGDVVGQEHSICFIRTLHAFRTAIFSIILCRESIGNSYASTALIVIRVQSTVQLVAFVSVSAPSADSRHNLLHFFLPHLNFFRTTVPILLFSWLITPKLLDIIRSQSRHFKFGRRISVICANFIVILSFLIQTPTGFTCTREVDVLVISNNDN